MIPEEELVVLDTNILVAYIRGNNLAKYIESEFHLLDRTKRPCICVVTKGEILALAKEFGWGSDKTAYLSELLLNLVLVDINRDSFIEKYAELKDFLRNLKPAITIQQNDMWIAAITSVLDANLITTDTDFIHLSPGFIKLHLIDEKKALIS